MKTVKLSIAATNAKKQNVNVTLSIRHYRAGVAHRFAAQIVESSIPVEWGTQPTGYYSDGTKVTGSQNENNELMFGTGEIERQYTYPFCLFPSGSNGSKNERILFQLPLTKQQLLKQFQ